MPLKKLIFMFIIVIGWLNLWTMKNRQVRQLN